VNEDVEMAARAFARFVEQARARFAQTRGRRAEIGHAQGDVMEAGAAFCEKFGDGRIGRGWFEELDARIAGGEKSGVDSFGGDRLGMSYVET